MAGHAVSGRSRLLVGLVGLALVAAACTTSDDASTTSTTAPPASTTTTSTTVADTTSSTTTIPPTTTTTIPPTTTTSVVEAPICGDDIPQEECDATKALLAEHAHEIITVFFAQTSNIGSRFIPLKDTDPYGGAALVLAEVWDYRFGASWDSSGIIGYVPPRSKVDWTPDSRTFVYVEAGSDPDQIFPLGDDRWIAYGMYNPVAGSFWSDNMITDFIFHVDGDRAILEDMVTWTSQFPTASVKGYWMHDMVYGPEIGEVKSNVSGTTINVLRGAVNGFVESELAYTISLNFEAISDDDYRFEGADDTYMRGEYGQDMLRMHHNAQEVGDPDWVWNSMWGAQSDSDGVTALSFYQTQYTMRAVSEPLIYYFESFGALSIGNAALDMPRGCGRRDSTEPVSWDADKGFWTCLQPNDYAPDFEVQY